MMIDGYTALSRDAEDAMDISIASPVLEGRDEALSLLDDARSCWDHLEEQINVMIYMDAENRSMIRKVDWQVIRERHGSWAKVLGTIESARARHDALRVTYVNHEQLQ